MRVALAAHDEVLRGVVEAHAGWMFKHTGDGVCAAFSSADDAIAAAVEAQRRLGLPVRMGIATGSVELRGDDYFGPALNRTARLMSAGHGGQILVAAATAALAAGRSLIDLGVHRLPDLSDSRARVPGESGGVALRVLTVADVGCDTGEPSGPVHELDRAHKRGEGSHRARAGSSAGDIDRRRRSGKTRLALQVAAELTGEFPDGVWLIELAPVVDPSAVPDAVARRVARVHAGRNFDRGECGAGLVRTAAAGGVGQLRACTRRERRAGGSDPGRCTDGAGAGDKPGRTAGRGGTVMAGAVTRCPSRDGVPSGGVVRRTGRWP